MEAFKTDPFEKEFSKRESIDIGNGGVAEVVDVSPQRPGDKPPILLDPATLVPLDIYKYVIRDFVRAGRRTLSLNHPRTGGTTEVPPQDFEYAKQFPQEQLRQALTLIKVLDAKDIDGLEALGHSQRGVSDVIAALLMQRRAERGEGKQRIRNLILFESAGLVGEDNVFRLAKGFVEEPSTRGKWGSSFDAIPVSDEERARAETAGHVIPEYKEIVPTAEDSEKGNEVRDGQRSQYSANPIRAFKEITSLPHVDMGPWLAELKGKVGIIVISGASDKVFPMEKIVGSMDPNEITKPKEDREIVPGTLNTENVDMFLPFRGDHALRVPQVPYIEGWLSQWENKQDRDTTKNR